MSLIKYVILGIVEGLTEFLPISSTGHLILTSKILNLNFSDFTKSFIIAIQVGAILAVLILYWRVIFDYKALYRVFVAFVPTAILGILLYKIIKNFLLDNYKIVLISLFLGGSLLIIFELFYKKVIKKVKYEISIKDALIIGLFQAIAFVPGVSRSLATILAGLSLGIDRKTIVEFSFLLAVPTILGATVFDLTKTFFNFTYAELIYLIVGFFVAFFVALISIKFFLKYIQKNNFILFGIYRIIISILCLVKI